MIVRYIDNSSAASLTHGKLYDCVEEYILSYVIKNDFGNKLFYSKWRFTDVTREEKLKKLL